MNINEKLTIYIKVGFQEPTIFVAVLGENTFLAKHNMGNVSASEIVEGVKFLQQETCNLSNLQPIFSLEPEPCDSNFKEYLQENGIDNVVIADEKEWKNIMEIVEERRE